MFSSLTPRETPALSMVESGRASEDLGAESMKHEPLGSGAWWENLQAPPPRERAVP